MLMGALKLDAAYSLLLCKSSYDCKLVSDLSTLGKREETAPLFFTWPLFSPSAKSCFLIMLRFELLFSADRDVASVVASIIPADRYDSGTSK